MKGKPQEPLHVVRRKRPRRRLLSLALSHLFAATVSFQAGLVYHHLMTTRTTTRTTNDATIHCNSRNAILLTLQEWMHRSSNSNTETSSVRKQQQQRRKRTNFLSTLTSSRVVVPRDDFTSLFPLGFPVKPSEESNHQVLIFLAQNQSHHPNNSTTAAAVVSLKEAVKQCQIMNVLNVGTVAAAQRNEQTCLAIVGVLIKNKRSNHENELVSTKDTVQRPKSPVFASSSSSYYDIFKWIRIYDSKQQKGYQPVPPLQYVSRYSAPNNPRVILSKPEEMYIDTETALAEVAIYLSLLENVKKDLRPMVQSVAAAGKNHGTFIVMVSNFGHADVLINFCCAARVAGLDLSKILLFATDVETRDLAQHLELGAVYYHPTLFASIPTNASSFYGNAMYAKIMASKLYCVHLVMSVLTDTTASSFLFQDLDIIVYNGTHYLDYFVNKIAPPNQKETTKNNNKQVYDFYFQNDENGREVYQPWSANSGCYFVRNNALTQYFFSNMMITGLDRILQAHSHQAAKHSFLSQHETLYGLRIQTFMNEETLLFPIGFHYHRKKEFVREMILANKTNVMSFHMNWNSNKQIKQEFLEQMGDWYVRPVCQEKTASQIVVVAAAAVEEASSLLHTCCAVEPLLQCHYRDKPSLRPCKDSPNFEKTGTSFWP